MAAAKRGIIGEAHAAYRHGGSLGYRQSKLYQVWNAMRQRCENPNHKSYEYYGGRGIKVCDRWADFANFAADMGEKPEGLTLDRIDNDADYGPSNCRWITRKEQSENRRPRRWRRKPI